MTFRQLLLAVAVLCLAVAALLAFGVISGQSVAGWALLGAASYVAAQLA